MSNEEKKSRKRRSREEVLADAERRVARLKWADAREAVCLMRSARAIMEEADAAWRGLANLTLTPAVEAISERIEAAEAAIPPEGR